MNETQKLARNIFHFGKGNVPFSQCWEIAKNSILIKEKLK